MKFGKHLRNYSVAGWEEQYIGYKKLKRFMNKIGHYLNEKNSRESTSSTFNGSELTPSAFLASLRKNSSSNNSQAVRRADRAERKQKERMREDNRAPLLDNRSRSETNLVVGSVADELKKSRAVAITSPMAESDLLSPSAASGSPALLSLSSANQLTHSPGSIASDSSPDVSINGVSPSSFALAPTSPELISQIASAYQEMWALFNSEINRINHFFAEKYETAQYLYGILDNAEKYQELTSKVDSKEQFELLLQINLTQKQRKQMEISARRKRIEKEESNALRNRDDMSMHSSGIQISQEDNELNIPEVQLPPMHDYSTDEVALENSNDQQLKRSELRPESSVHSQHADDDSDMDMRQLERARKAVLSHSPMLHTRENASIRKSQVALGDSRSVSNVAGNAANGAIQLDEQEIERKHLRCDGLLAVYRQIVSLMSYRELNYAAISKLLKKYEKETEEVGRRERALKDIRQEAFYTYGSIQPFLNKIERSFIKLAKECHQDERIAQDVLYRVRVEVYSPQIQEGEKLFKPIWIGVSAVLAIIAAFIPVFTDDAAAHRFLAILVGTVSLWVSEAVPFWVASFMLSLAVCVSHVVVADPLTAADASKLVFQQMISDTFMLVLGGFALSAAFVKCQFELVFASWAQQKFGTRPNVFMLVIMLMSGFLSMWISNVAAPIMFTSILMPIIHDLPQKSKYPRALIYALSVACNVGGMLSPISSPQNSVALGDLPSDKSISFGVWCIVGGTFGFIAIVVCWIFIYFSMLRRDSFPIDKIPPILYEKRKMTATHYTVIAVSLLTIALWCSAQGTENYIGKEGTVAMIPLIFFFATGILQKTDLQHFSWHLLLLIAGGNVLGYAAQQSGLLSFIGDPAHPENRTAIAQFLGDQSEYASFILVLLVAFIVATFISHTICAIILVPVIIQIAEASGGQMQILVLGAVMTMSIAMSLPTSSFPNLNALLQENDSGVRYLKTKHFLMYGTAISCILFCLMISLGYGLLNAIL